MGAMLISAICCVEPTNGPMLRDRMLSTIVLNNGTHVTCEIGNDDVSVDKRITAAVGAEPELTIATHQGGSMNYVQRRLFRAFAESGGDLHDTAQMRALVGFVEAQVAILPGRLGGALDVFLQGDDETSYNMVAGRLGVQVATARQRVSRGVRQLEAAIRCQCWATRDRCRFAGRQRAAE